MTDEDETHIYLINRSSLLLLSSPRVLLHCVEASIKVWSERGEFEYKSVKISEMNGNTLFPTSIFGAPCDGCNLWKMNQLICKYGSDVIRGSRNFIKVLLDFLLYVEMCAHWCYCWI